MRLNDADTMGWKAIGRLTAGALVCAILLAGASCKSKETRVSVATYRAMEQEAAAVEPVKVTPSNLALTEVQPYTVASGDVLNLTLVGLESTYSQTALRTRVHEDGSILLPLIGRLTVEGKTLAGVEEAIINAYVPKYVKAMSTFVELIGPEATTVMVVGAAGQRGLVTLANNQRNVLYALAMAGGFNPGTSGHVRVRPIDPTRKSYTVDLNDMNDLRRAMQAEPLQTGDVIVVEAAKANVIYTTGLVNAPGPIAVPEGSELSVVRAIAAAGGLPDLIEPKTATIWRRMPDGQQVRIKLELADVMAGKGDEFMLRPGDVLEVPQTLETRFRQWFFQNIRIGPFSVGTHYDPIAQYNANRALDDDDDFNFGRSLRDSLGFGVQNYVYPQVFRAVP